MRVEGPGLGLVTYSSSDLSSSDDRWYCTRAPLVVKTAHALDVIESELYKLGAKALSLIPPLPTP